MSVQGEAVGRKVFQKGVLNIGVRTRHVESVQETCTVSDLNGALKI